MASRQVVHSIAAILTCGWILFSNSMLCVAAPSCDGAIFLRTEGPYEYGQEVAIRVIISPEIHYPNGQVYVFSGNDKRHVVAAEDLGDGVWDAKIRIPLRNNWNRKIGFRLWQGKKIVCEKTKTVDMQAGMVMDIKGPEWSCAGYPAEYELIVGGDASFLFVRWNFGQEEHSRYVNAQGRDVQRIRWKTPGDKSVIATISAWRHPVQTMMINTRVAPVHAGLVVEGPLNIQQGKLKDWTIVAPPIGPRHMDYHMELEVDWGQGETSRYVNRNRRFEIQKRFVRPGTYTVGLRLLERNVSPLLEKKFIVKVIENKARLDLQVTGPEQVTSGTPACWTARTTRGRPPYEFSVELWNPNKKLTLSSESNAGKFNLNLYTPGKKDLLFQVVDADGMWSGWHYVKVLVTPEKNDATVENVTQGSNTTTTGRQGLTPSPTGGNQGSGSTSGAPPVQFNGLVIQGRSNMNEGESINLKAEDLGGRPYPSATWISRDPKVLSVSSNGTVQGLKSGTAAVVVKVGSLSASHVIKVRFNPFTGASGNGQTTGSGPPEIYGGLVIQGTSRIAVNTSAYLQALDHGGRAYAEATWDSSNTEVLTVSGKGEIRGNKPGSATVIAHVDDMGAYKDIVVVENGSPGNQGQPGSSTTGGGRAFQPGQNNQGQQLNGNSGQVVGGASGQQFSGNTGRANGDSSKQQTGRGSDSGDASVDDADSSGSLNLGGVSMGQDDGQDSEETEKKLGFKFLERSHEFVSPETPPGQLTVRENPLHSGQDNQSTSKLGELTVIPNDGQNLDPVPEDDLWDLSQPPRPHENRSIFGEIIQDQRTIQHQETKKWQQDDANQVECGRIHKKLKNARMKNDIGLFKRFLSKAKARNCTFFESSRLDLKDMEHWAQRQRNCTSIRTALTNAKRAKDVARFESLLQNAKSCEFYWEARSEFKQLKNEVKKQTECKRVYNGLQEALRSKNLSQYRFYVKQAKGCPFYNTVCHGYIKCRRYVKGKGWIKKGEKDPHSGAIVGTFYTGRSEVPCSPPRPGMIKCFNLRDGKWHCW